LILTISLPVTGDATGGRGPFVGGSSTAVGAIVAIKNEVQIVFEVDLTFSI
jgi:hypothetical protein